MFDCRICFRQLLCFLVCGTALVSAQEKSVRPGVNDAFRNPDVAEFAGRFETESREVFAQRKAIVTACQLKPGDVVADIGAGTGLFTLLFAEAVGPRGQVFAVDISPKFLDHIQKLSHTSGLPNVKTQLAKDDSVELAAESIDVAYICDTYHHFEFPHKTMASLHRALKPGGRLILIDFHRIPGKSSEWALGHVRAGQDVFESEIVQAGFQKSREVTSLLSENYFVEFQKSSTPGLKPLQHPIIAGYGGVAQVERATERPRSGAKVVLDVTAGGDAAKVNKGLDRAARLLNLYGLAGMQAKDVSVAVVLHGDATAAVLNDEFYAARFNVEKNPNGPLISALRKAGVEIFVCGQALNYKGFAESTVIPDVGIADAALSVLINRQNDGYAFLLVP